MKLLLLCLLTVCLSGCANYQSTVSEREIEGYAKDDAAGVRYTVRYK